MPNLQCEIGPLIISGLWLTKPYRAKSVVTGRLPLGGYLNRVESIAE